MILPGCAWFLGPLAAADSALLFTLGIPLGSIWGAVLAHVLLSFPSGRLDAGLQSALVVAAYLLVPLVPVPAMLVSEPAHLVCCDGPCPENLLLVERNDGLADIFLAAGRRSR